MGRPVNPLVSTGPWTDDASMSKEFILNLERRVRSTMAVRVSEAPCASLMTGGVPSPPVWTAGEGLRMLAAHQSARCHD